jgi:AAA+ ATPase superfamily predicted ATPase
MEFHGRHRELKALQEAWSSGRSGFIPIYGRRRVGKSELIVRFMDEKPGLYFVGKRAPGQTQLAEFLAAAARALKEPLLAKTQVVGWKDAFELVAQRAPKDGKFILTLDEFQWMVEANPELPSVLQELWDRFWSRSGRILLILCGSYIGFMEKEVLGSRSPLFGRRTGQILLRPFNHLEAARFHPHLSVVDQARIYAVCGGVPAYLLEFDEQLSVEQNLMRRLLTDTSTLAREPDFLLREELRDLAPYHAILTGLAGGAATPTRLAKATGIDVRALSHFLNALMGLGYVRRRVPLTAPAPGPRSVHYALDDPLLRFWFRFVFPEQSTLRFLGPQRGFAEIVRPSLDAYFGLCFEHLCREALPLIYLAEGVTAAFDIGEYWDPGVQIDVVGIRRDNWTDLGECKWGSVSSHSSLAAEMEAKVRAYPNARNATICRRLFVRSLKSTKAPSGVRLHTLEDLYALEMTV